jgi:hypothetical protein
MIKFFRHIRQTLIMENKTGKYLKYAIGEIILVVIGILLALYLNNLKDLSQLKKDEIKILKEIKSNLKISMQSYEETITNESIYLASNELLLDHFSNKKPYTNELDTAFGIYFWTILSHPVTGAYENLKSKGLEFISNDSLRNNITFMFENEFPEIKNGNELWANNLQISISYPYHVKRFIRYFPKDKDSLNQEYAKPIDYDMLVADKTFQSINAELISNRRFNINSLKALVQRIQVLITEIDLELNKLQ